MIPNPSDEGKVCTGLHGSILTLIVFIILSLSFTIIFPYLKVLYLITLIFKALDFRSILKIIPGIFDKILISFKSIELQKLKKSIFL